MDFSGMYTYPRRCFMCNGFLRVEGSKIGRAKKNFEASIIEFEIAIRSYDVLTIAFKSTSAHFKLIR